MAAFTKRITARLQDIDGAGVLFFANQLVYAHETYEEFMEQIGFSFAEIFGHSPFLLFIVHAEADYVRPVSVGDIVDIEMNVASIGRTSFAIDYRLRTDAGEDIGRCRTVHVTVSRTKKTKTPVPAELRKKLAEYMAHG